MGDIFLPQFDEEDQYTPGQSLHFTVNSDCKKALDAAYNDFLTLWNSAFKAKTDSDVASKAKSNYLKIICETRLEILNDMSRLRTIQDEKAVNEFLQDEHRQYQTFEMFYSLHKSKTLPGRDYIDAFNDREYSWCKLKKPDFIVITRLFFESNLKRENRFTN